MDKVIKVHEMYLMTQDELYDYVLDYVKASGSFDIQTSENLMYIACFPKDVEQPCPILAAHLDIYNSIPPERIVIQKTRNGDRLYVGYRGADRCILSADDRNGVWTMLKHIKAGKTNWGYFFSRDEEKGRFGAKALMGDNVLKKHDERVSFFIQIDRKGENDLAYYSLRDDAPDYYSHGNSRFKDKINSFESYKVVPGGLTDIVNYCGITGICGINISAGYYNEHTPRPGRSSTFEYSSIQYIENLPGIVERLINHLGTEQYLIEGM